MRFHVSVLSVIGVGGTAPEKKDDPCDDLCQTVTGLCDTSKGSWCNESGFCQNLFMSKML